MGPEEVKELAEAYLIEGTGTRADVMSSKCFGGGGATTSAAPGCADLSDQDTLATDQI
jgi:hypothetical protein